jgi:hypothetical protein
MTYAKYVTLCALFGYTDAFTEITVDDEKIGRVGNDFVDWVGGQLETNEAQRTLLALNKAAHKAQLRIDLRQRDIF